MPDIEKPVEQTPAPEVAAPVAPAPPALTPAQIAEEKRLKALADAKAARIKQVQEIRARRAELEKNIGQVFTDGEHEATIESLDKNNIKTETGWLTDDYFTVNFGNPHIHKHFKVEEFLKNFQPKGTK